MYNGYHGLTTFFANISYIAIFTIKSADYHCIQGISKSGAIHLFENSVLEDREYM